MADDPAPHHHPAALIWGNERLAYDFGPHHPLQPVRVELTVALIRACQLTEAEHVSTLPPAAYTEDEVLRLHRPEYVEAVRSLSADPDPKGDPRHGLGALGDNPVFKGMHEASLGVCGMSVAAAEAVWSGQVTHAFNPAGGLHHAMPNRASGFCIYNDPACAIDWLLRQGVERVAYVDVDTHHGDGVQHLFYEDPRVLTVSLHESGRYLFPGTGFTREIGTGDARGTSLNVPLAPSTTGDVYLEAFDAVVPPALAAFAPQVLVTQLGCDTHVTDPLAHLSLITGDYQALATRLHRLAHEYADGRWVATGGGGYRLAAVVPRAWTIYFAELAGAPLPGQIPHEWLDTATEAVGERPPPTFDDDPLHLADDTREGCRREARDSVESLKREAFDLLEQR